MASELNYPLIGINWEYLCQHWIPSYGKQQTDGYHITFRPEGFKLPEDFKESPQRLSLVHRTFYENGEFELFFYGFCGYRSAYRGKWRVDPDDKSVLQMADNHGFAESYRIVELTKDILRMVALASP